MLETVSVYERINKIGNDYDYVYVLETVITEDEVYVIYRKQRSSNPQQNVSIVNFLNEYREYKPLSDKEVYSQMVEKFGFEKQSLMAIEEYSESTKTITKLHRAMDNESRVYPHDLKEDFIEELVDVEIMVNQMKTTLDEEDMKLFDKFHNEKMDRCRKMLEE